jgi:hypothetical protein
LAITAARLNGAAGGVDYAAESEERRDRHDRSE